MGLRRPGPVAGRVLGLTGVWLVGLALTGAMVLGQGRGLTPQERQQTLAQAALICDLKPEDSSELWAAPDRDNPTAGRCPSKYRPSA